MRQSFYFAILFYLSALMMAGCVKQKSVGEIQMQSGMTVINTVSFTEDGMMIEVTGDLSESYNVQKPYDPYTVIVEIPGVGLGDTPSELSPDVAIIDTVRLSMAQTPTLFTRFEIILTEPRDVVASKDGKYLVLKFLSSGATLQKEKEKPLEVAATVDATGEEVIELLPATEVTAFAFDLRKEELRFIVYSDGALNPEVFTLKERIIVDIPGVKLSAPAPEALVDPVKGVRFGRYEDKVRIVLDLDQDRDFLAITEDNKTVISIRLAVQKYVAYGDAKSMKDTIGKPATVEDEAMDDVPLEETPAETAVAQVPDKKGKAVSAEKAQKKPAASADKGAKQPSEEAAAKSEESQLKKRVTEGGPAPAEDEVNPSFQIKTNKYTGKLISLDFQNADVVPIYRFLAEIGGYNVVIHPSVSGKITLKLINVPWDQALDIILELSNQGKSLDGNILRIAPPTVFVKQKEDSARMKAAQETVVELEQIAINLKHISASEMQTRLNEAKSTLKGEGAAAAMDRGSMRIDERTNTLIIRDTPDTIRRIQEVEIPYWDTPEHGTMQVLIEAKIVSVRTDYTHSLGIRWGGSADSSNFSFISDAATLDFSVNTPVSPAGPTATAAGALVSIGYTETLNLSLSLNALETVSKAKSLANPRVLTLDKQSASISKGTAIPYAAQAEGGGTTIETQDATLSLTVTPEIQPNDIIKLTVNVTNDSPTSIPGASAPGIDKQQIQTAALVKNGETLVLGGIFTSTEDESEVRVPLLSRVPVLGWLFKTRNVSRIPNELLIFITPRIVE